MTKLTSPTSIWVASTFVFTAPNFMLVSLSDRTVRPTDFKESKRWVEARNG